MFSGSNVTNLQTLYRLARPVLSSVAMLAALAIGMQPAHGQLFESDSKRLGNSKMDIVVREVERRPFVSVLNIEVNTVGSSVGSSFFLLCSVRQLARLRGNYRYIAKIEKHNKPAQMIVGFLDGQEASLDKLGQEFRTLKSPQDVIDLEQFASICDTMK